MSRLRFKPGDVALLLYTRTFHERPPCAGEVVYIHRIRVIEDPFDQLPCDYVVSDQPLTRAGMVQGYERWVLDCQLAPLGSVESDADEEEVEREDAL